MYPHKSRQRCWKGRSKLFVKAPFNVGKTEDSTLVGHSVYDALDESDALGFARKLLSALPSNNADAIYVDTSDDLNRAVLVDGEAYEVDSVLTDIADDGEFIGIYGDYAKTMRFGFASFGGVLSGVVACDPKAGGALDEKAARAAAKLVGFCDSFGLPVVTLVDSEGTVADADAENGGYAEALAKLAYAYSSADNAKVTVVMNKAYGAAYTLLGSKSVGADIVFALPTAKISVLSPEASVAFVWNDRVSEKSREELEAEWNEKCASPAAAADDGEVDDIIEPSELRKRICAALAMLCAKSQGTPCRKHFNMPL